MKFMAFIFMAFLCSCDDSSAQKEDFQTEEKAEPEEQKEKNPRIKKFREKPMLVLGDSIGVGLLSDTKLGNSYGMEHPLVSKLVNIYMGSSNVTDPLPHLDKSYLEKPSAFRGKNIKDMKCFSLNCQIDIPSLLVFNGSVSRSTVEDLIERSEKFDRDYGLVVTEVGANDICSESYDKSQFVKSYKDLLNKVSSKAEAVLIVPVPDIASVYGVAPSELLSSQVSVFVAQISLTCGKIRDGVDFGLDPFCPRALKLSQEQMRKDIEDVNLELEELVNEMNKKEGSIDYIFAKDISNLKITREDLAVDCFHPNIEMHKKIAKSLGKDLKSFYK